MSSTGNKNNWQILTLLDVCTFINGKAYKQEELLQHGKYRVLRVGNFFTNGDWYYSDLELTADKYVEKGDLMYAWSASFGPKFWNEEKTIYHYHIWKVLPHENINKLFLFYFFDFDKQKIINNKQGGTMFHVTKGDMEKRKIILPPLPEQKIIASILSKWDEAIETLEQLIAKKERYKKALMQKLLTGKVRFKEFKGEKWIQIPLGEIADVSKLAGYEFTKHIVYENEGKIIALRGLNIKNNRLDLTDVKYIDNSELSKLNRSKLYIDDLMFTYIGTIGEVALIDKNDRYYLAPNVSRIRADKARVEAKYLLQYFNLTDFKQNEISKYISSSSQPALTMENVRKFIINLPPVKEQNRIAGILSSVDEEIGSLKANLNLYKNQKQGLMQQLLTGKMRVKV